MTEADADVGTDLEDVTDGAGDADDGPRDTSMDGSETPEDVTVDGGDAPSSADSGSRDGGAEPDVSRDVVADAARGDADRAISEPDATRDAGAVDTGGMEDVDTGGTQDVDAGVRDGGGEAGDVGDTGPVCSPSSCPSRPHATATCTDAGTCNYTCNQGWFDCDGVASNGCESRLDSDSFQQKGCSDAVFVSKSQGDDSNDGLTPASAVQTIEKGLDVAANRSSRARVLVSRDRIYHNRVKLESGVDLVGGYDATSRWSHDPKQHPTDLQPRQGFGRNPNHPRVVVADQLSADVRLRGFDIRAPNAAPGSGASTYGVWVAGSSNYLTILDTRIEAGDGGSGLDGRRGRDGRNGRDGRPANSPTGGQGGGSGCEAGGGSGGSATAVLNRSGESGDNGKSSTNSSVKGGSGGSGGANDSTAGGCNAGDGGKGRDGRKGRDGLEGRPGTEGEGSFQNNGLWSADAQPRDPTDGQSGTGGGGGGAGGSCLTPSTKIDASGGGGGGAGAGGCGGNAGQNGNSGGGAFGLVVDGSTVQLERVDISMARGGNGGAGARGGDGGRGGDGASGLDPDTNAGDGAEGGDGGRGGKGGDGAGGCGGVSIGIARVGSNAKTTGNYTVDDNNAEAGSGGSGAGDAGDGCDGIKRKQRDF